MRNKIILIFAALAVTPALLSACSAEKISATLQAVEVGNPEDRRPGKPIQPKPMRLVQIELETQDLEEISQIDFTPENIRLVVSTASGTPALVPTSDVPDGSRLTLLPKNKKSLQFNLPADALDLRPEIQLRLKFGAQSAGTVKVASNSFAIDTESDSIDIQLSQVSASPANENILILNRVLTKDVLFGPKSKSAVGSPTEPNGGGGRPDGGVGSGGSTPSYKVRKSL